MIHYYQPQKFKQDEKDIKNYQTASEEAIHYKSLFPNNVTYGNKTRRSSLWEKKLSSGYNDYQLKPGEFATVEQLYSKAKLFDFTTRNSNKIKSAADVAFIFRKLESSAVEHAFAVYVDKKSTPYVQWMSMGGITGTVADARLMIDAANKLEAKKIYFVHNHPSGNLKPSQADFNIMHKLKSGFSKFGIEVYGIIINLNSGKYCEFSNPSDFCDIFDTYSGFSSEDYYKEKKVNVFAFDKKAFLQSPTNQIIQKSEDVARFLSQQRFSSGQKSGYLFLSQSSEVVANFFATKTAREEAAKEVLRLAGKFGATGLIAYTNHDIEPAFYRNLKNDLSNFDIRLLDVIQVESSQAVQATYDEYLSMADEGLLEPSGNYQTPKTNTTMEKHYDLGFGFRGSGTTVWNRNEIENNDYKTIAYIPDNNGEIQFFDKDLPEKIKEEIRSSVSNKPDISLNRQHRDHGGDTLTPEQELQLEFDEFDDMHQRSMDMGDDIDFDFKLDDRTDFEVREDRAVYEDESVYSKRNLDFLSKQLFYHGFGKLSEELQKVLQNGESKVDLPISKSYYRSPVDKTDSASFVLHLQKASNSNMYFFNSYSAKLDNIGNEQTFYLNKGKGFTAKEAFNLLSGRSVYKQLTTSDKPMHVWLQLRDATSPNQNYHVFGDGYGFNLKEALSRLPLKELGSDAETAKLMNRLQKGDLLKLTFQAGDDTATKYIAANPQFKAINLYNENGSRMFFKPERESTQNLLSVKL